MSYPKCFTTRSRSISGPRAVCFSRSVGGSLGASRPLLLLVLLWGLGSGGLMVGAQPAAGTIKSGTTAGPAAASATKADSVAKNGVTSAQAADNLAATKPLLASSPASQAAVDSATTPVAATSAAPTSPAASGWSTAWGVLFGMALGALGAWLWARRSAKLVGAVRPRSDAMPAASARRKLAENVWESPDPLGAADAPTAAGSPAAASAPPVSAAPREVPPAEAPGKRVSVKSMREVQGNAVKQSSKSAGSNNPNKKSKSNFNSRPSAADAPPGGWPPVPHRPAAMHPTPPTPPPPGNDQPLETGQTIEWAAPTSTPAAIQEMIAASEPAAALSPEAAAGALAPAPDMPASGNGPLHYYAPAPDLPSIEHRKLSPTPLPQMPLFITLAHAAAETAQFSFSPQADQSRIIGNGVRELKEFFQFELPPTEQFTSIKNLSPGRLEKRDDAWHVVQKAEIALS